MSKKFDARCTGCGNVHIVTLPEHANEAVGDDIQIAHNTGRHACGSYIQHYLLRRLDGLERMREERV